MAEARKGFQGVGDAMTVGSPTCEAESCQQARCDTASDQAEKIKQAEVQNDEKYDDHGDGAVFAFFENFLKAHWFTPAWAVGIVLNSDGAFLDAGRLPCDRLRLSHGMLRQAGCGCSACSSLTERVSRLPMVSRSHTSRI